MSDIVERAKAALEGVTEGPWISWKSRLDDGLPCYPGNVMSDATKQIVFTQTGNSANTQFVAAARTLVPELVAEVELLRFDQDWFTKRLQDELDPGGGDEWDADDVVQIVRDLEAENERLRAENEQLRRQIANRSEWDPAWGSPYDVLGDV